MIKAVIYARVSSREQEREGYSIPAQLKLLNDYANKKNLKIAKEFTDNETAKKEGRTNFTEMVKFLKKNKDVRVILVEKTDRLYRNFKDYVLLDGFEGLEVHLVKEGTSLSENSRSHDKFIHGIKVLMAKNYIDNLSEEVKKGFQEKAEQGEYPAKPPFGYKRESSKNIIIDKSTAPFIIRAFNLYAEGSYSLQKVIDKLYDEGFIYKPQKPKIGKSHLESVLKNIFYIGNFVFKGRIYSGNHEPLIDRELFEKVQDAFKKDNKPLYRKEHDFAFAGLFICGECGSSITAEIKKSKYIYYHCTHGKGECSQDKYIREEEIQKQLKDAIKNISITDEHKEWLIQALKESSFDKQEYHNERIESLEKQCKKLRERIHGIYIDKLDGVITEEFWLEKHNQWTVELDKLQTIMQAHDKANKTYIESGISIIELANKAYDLYSSQSLHEKTKLLKTVLSNFFIEDGKASYTYKKPFDILAKGLNCSFTLGRKDSNL